MRNLFLITGLLGLLLLSACGDSESYLNQLTDPRYTLENEVRSCLSKHDTSLEGYDIGRYRPGSRAVFKTEIDLAQTILANPGATDAQLETGLIALYQAQDAFNSQRYDMYTSLVDKSFHEYDIAVEGSAEREYFPGAKDALWLVWDADHATVTNTRLATPVRNEAWWRLREAFVKFKELQKFTAVKISMASINPVSFNTNLGMFGNETVLGVPLGTYRFIELFNNSDEDIDIASWSLQTCKYKNPSSPGYTVKRIEFNAYGDSLIIKARSYFLISRDDIWGAGVQPDFVVADMEMYVGDGERGLAVVKVNDSFATNGSPLIVDAVGYTNYESTSVTAGFYETKPLHNTRLFVRKWDALDANSLQDTDDNRADFYNISIESNKWRLPRNSQYSGPCSW